MKNEDLNKLIENALREDNARKDITTRILVPARKLAKAVLIAREKGIICGVDVFCAVFRSVDKHFKFKTKCNDGSSVRVGEEVLEMTGPARAILSGERTALNFIQHLSGIATYTNNFVLQTLGTRAKIYDTRKTLPCLRVIEKYAVRCGGGANHRMSLADMVLIKDNHLKMTDNLGTSLSKIRKLKPKIKIEMECDNFTQVAEAMKLNVDIIMLDNMDVKEIRQSLKIIKENGGVQGNPEVEISGGINLNSVRKYALTGVDRISVGALTHSAKALDLSLEIY